MRVWPVPTLGISFPRDEGWHPGSTDEWWYFNCHVSSAEGRNYAFAACFFPQFVLDILVDVSGRRVIHKHGLTGLKFESAASGLDLRMGPSWWRKVGDEPATYDLHYEAEGLSCDLKMTASKRPLLLGGTGLIREGLLGESYYYAQTSLKVTGELVLDGRRTALKGKGWIDRQWGDWEWSGLGGWRWFSIQLEGEVEIAGIQFSHPLTGAVSVQSFSLSRPDGGGEVIGRVGVQELAKWRSPGSKFEYGLGWRVWSPGRFDLVVRPDVESQEINKGLWEGGCSVSGTYEGSESTGRAFVELSAGRIYGRTSVRAVLLAIGLLDRTLTKVGVRLRLAERATATITRLWNAYGRR